MATGKYKVEMIGGDVAISKLHTLTGFVKDEAIPLIGKHVKNEVKEFEQTAYPAELPFQVYQRTGKLGRSFFARKRGRVWQLVNNRYAAKWIIDTRHQIMVHLGRWWGMHEETAQRLPRLVKLLLKGVDDVFND